MKMKAIINCDNLDYHKESYSYVTSRLKLIDEIDAELHKIDGMLKRIVGQENKLYWSLLMSDHELWILRWKLEDSLLEYYNVTDKEK